MRTRRANWFPRKKVAGHVATRNPKQKCPRSRGRKASGRQHRDALRPLQVTWMKPNLVPEISCVVLVYAWDGCFWTLQHRFVLWRRTAALTRMQLGSWTSPVTGRRGVILLALLCKPYILTYMKDAGTQLQLSAPAMLLLFCGTHHVSQHTANSSASCCTVRSAYTTYARESDRLNSSAPCATVFNHSGKTWI